MKLFGRGKFILADDMTLYCAVSRPGQEMLPELSGKCPAVGDRPEGGPGTLGGHDVKKYVRVDRYSSV